ncbi:MAG TPA: ABC transporter ATP-binding protein [Nitrospinota bacterium]|nr:ABC transporter ATP-binding protein [Nitrospinota bacterium]
MKNIFKEVSPKQWKNDFYTIKELTKSHYLRLALACVSGLFLSSINGAIAWYVKPVLDGLFVERNNALLMVLPIGVFFLFVLRGLFAFSNNYLMFSIGAKVVREFRHLIFEKILRLPMSFFSQKSSGSIISKVLNDMKILEGLIAHTAKNFIVQSTTVVILSFVALYRRWDLALISFSVVPVVVLVFDRFGKRMKKTSATTLTLISNVTEIIHETLSGIKIVKAFTMEKEMSTHNKHSVSEHYRNVMREVRIGEFTTVCMEIIAGAGVALILWYGSYLILSKQLSVGAFFSFVTAVLMIYNPLKRLSQVNNNFQRIRSALHRIKEIFILEDEQDGTIEKDVICGSVFYKNVSFRYPESKEMVLNNINLELLQGETVAIVGYSGVGKSTLADLLLGFWKSYDGEILIDGINIKDFSLQNLRSHIGIVSQDIILFNDTAKNNIKFGKPDASDEEIIEAAKRAYAHDFINEMPQGYDSNVGERGIKLSGGQKQRISLARAIIKNPKILVLDEATSLLDADSETKIQRAMESIKTGRTTIIIAHRLSTVQKADRIIVMDKGAIIQQGKHSDLSQQDGVYQELYRKSEIIVTP